MTRQRKFLTNELIPYRCVLVYAQVVLGFAKFSRTTLLAIAPVPT